VFTAIDVRGTRHAPIGRKTCFTPQGGGGEGTWPCTATRPRLVGCVRAGAAVGSSTGPLFVWRPGSCRLRPRRLGRFGLDGRTRRLDSTACSRQLLPSVPRSTQLHPAVARWPASGAGVVAERHGGQDCAAAHRGLDEVAAHKRDSLPAPWLLRAVGAENPVASCDLQILIEQASEPVSSSHPNGPSRHWWSEAGDHRYLVSRHSQSPKWHPALGLEASRARRENSASAPG
jgi:hypothetical protein